MRHDFLAENETNASINDLECVRSLKSLKGIVLHRCKVSVEKFVSLNMLLLGHW